jgi:ferredoxin
VEGRRGIPHARPPYPAECGLWGHPTLVNNVETLALVPWIVRGGADAFRAVGTAGSPGTKAFALAGKVVRGGLVEVPMGLSLGDVVERIGGGVGDGRPFKAVQVGGPSGGCIPASLADTPIDYEALTRVGGMMGSGGLVVLDASDCMVDIARYFLAFTQAESCGTCTVCRIGTRRMLEILNRLCEGEGRTGDIEALERLAEIVRAGSLCGLGRTAPNPVLSTLRHFRAEYEAHVRGVCPAHRCRALIVYRVGDRCIGCTLCAQNCPAEAIRFTPLEKAEIDAVRCTQCDSCRQLCPEKAIEIVDKPRRARLEPRPAPPRGKFLLYTQNPLGDTIFQLKGADHAPNHARVERRHASGRQTDRLRRPLRPVASGDVRQQASGARILGDLHLPGVHVALPDDGPAGLRHDHHPVRAGRTHGREQIAEALPVQFPQSRRFSRRLRQRDSQRPGRAHAPKYIEVLGRFHARGGIAIDPYVNYGRPGSAFAELAEARFRAHDATRKNTP